MNNSEAATLLRQQIPRWINASIMDFIKTVVARFNTGKIEILLEADWTIDKIRHHPELFVVSFDGPSFHQIGKTLRYNHNYTLSVSTHRKQNDMYAHERTVGVAVECFPSCLPIYRYGDGPLDDGNQLGVLQQVSNPKTFGHGVISTDTPVYQSSVSAQYRMDYSEE